MSPDTLSSGTNGAAVNGNRPKLNLKVIAHAIALTAIDRASDVIGAFLLPKATNAIKGRIPSPSCPWLTAPLWTKKTVDGAILSGASRKAGAKYAIPKGLPTGTSRALAIENEPHEADGFSGTISEGYGKGEKTLLADETVVIKIDGKTQLSRMNYHVHDAERAGLHYDLVVPDVPPGTKEWELHIPRGEFKGRFAFRQTDKGTIIVPMKDRGVQLPKPDYNLKTAEWLSSINPAEHVIERKYDGSLANVSIDEASRAAFRSHRDGGETYYDRLPAIEFLRNKSPFFTLRRLDPGPQLAGTVLKGELVHTDGVARVSGILNSHPEKAAIVQAKRGAVDFYAWDVIKVHGKDVSKLPEWQRRELLESLIRKIRLYNKHWHVVERYTGKDPVEFYERVISDPRGLPYAEGIVVKPREDSVGGRWFKVKNRDFADLMVVSISPSPVGTKYSDSVGVMVVEDPVTGGRGEVGSFAITDAQRDWIWQHREELIGATAKISVMEISEKGAPRAGVFHGWHPDPRYGGIGSEMALSMYAETAAGLDPVEAQRTLYAMKSSAGWRRK